MTVSLKHSFTSAKSDGTDSTLVQPSNWNAEHTLTLAAGKVLGRDSSAAGAAQELAISVDSTQQSMIPPKGTTAQRPSSGVAGMMRYNTSTSRFEGYSSAWGNLGGGATIAATAPTSPTPTSGDLWYDTANSLLKTYNGSAWVLPSPNATTVRQVFTATASQTSFTVSGGYAAGNVDVYQNGVKLVNGTDVTTTSGTAVVLAVGATTGDTIEVVGGAASGAAYLPIGGGTLTGALSGTTASMSGAVTAGGNFNTTGGTVLVNSKQAVNGPACSVYQSSAQTFSSGVATKVNLQAEDFDTDAAFDNVTNYRFLPLVAGYYQVSGRITMAATTSGTVLVTYLYKNGASYKAGESYIPPSGSSAMTSTLNSLVYLNGTTDYIEFWVNATGSGTITSSIGSLSTYFSAVMVRGA